MLGRRGSGLPFLFITAKVLGGASGSGSPVAEQET